MTDGRRFDRSWRRAIWGGIALSVVAHAALLAWVRFSIEGNGPQATAGPMVVIPLPEEPRPEPRDRPLQVVEIAARPAGGSPASASASAPRPAPVPSAPRVGEVSASLAVERPTRPVVFLDALDEPDEKENSAESYARVSDFLVAGSAEPGPFRPIDDRPVDVLARIGAGRGTGVSGGVGGGHCPPRRLDPGAR